jgi:hypothetical protein
MISAELSKNLEKLPPYIFTKNISIHKQYGYLYLEKP